MGVGVGAPRGTPVGSSSTRGPGCQVGPMTRRTAQEFEPYMTVCEICGIHMTVSYLMLSPMGRSWRGPTGWGPWCDRCGYWVRVQKSIMRNRAKVERWRWREFVTMVREDLGLRHYRGESLVEWYGRWKKLMGWR